jgi:hypothetical protein
MLLALWGVMGVTAVFAVTAWWVRGLLGVVAVGVTLHPLHLKTLKPEMMRSNQQILEGGDA